MAIHTTYTHARANLATLCDAVTRDREIVFIERLGAEPIALVAADELAGLMVTIHLLRSPPNARRLLRASDRAVQNQGTPQTIDGIAREMGLAELVALERLSGRPQASDP